MSKCDWTMEEAKKWVEDHQKKEAQAWVDSHKPKKAVEEEEIECECPECGKEFEGTGSCSDMMCPDCEVALGEKGCSGGKRKPKKTLEYKERWNPQWSKTFDVAAIDSTPSGRQMKILCAFLECKVKEVFSHKMSVGGALVGPYLTAFKNICSNFNWKDTRNFSWDGEYPPVYESIQVNRSVADDFLVDGTDFYTIDETPVILSFQPTWYGLSITAYTARKDKDVNKKVFADVEAWLKESHPLKMEKFSISGEFISFDENIDWKDLILSDGNTRVVSKIPTLLNKNGKNMNSRGVLMVGKPGCLHADTPVYDPEDKTLLTVKERWIQGKSFHVFSLDDEKKVVVAQAEPPWRYEPAEMVKFTFDSGKTITTTKGHRFWIGESSMQTDRDGFASAEEIVCNLNRGDIDVVLPSVDASYWHLSGLPLSPVQSILELDQPILKQDVFHLMGTSLNLKDHCSADSCLCGELPHPAEDNDLSASPLSDDVLQHSRVLWRLDDLADKCKDNVQASFSHHSNLGCTGPSGRLIADVYQPLSSQGSPVQHDDLNVCDELPRQLASLESTSPSQAGVLNRPNNMTFVSPFVSVCNSTPDYIRPEKIVKVELVETDNYYDFHVPNYENYWSVGMFHHNTGKTMTGKILMNKSDSTFIWISARDLGYGYKDTMKSAFKMGRDLAPSILFFEDIDHWLSDNSSLMDMLKTELDGVATNKGIVTMLTSNAPEKLPDALLDRPGRFHDVLEFGLPDNKARTSMLSKWADIEESDDLLSALVTATEGFSGAHMRELVEFAKTISEDEELDMGNALIDSLDKLTEQRELIQRLREKVKSIDEIPSSDDQLDSLYKSLVNKNCDSSIPEETIEEVFLPDFTPLSNFCIMEKSGRVISDKNRRLIQSVIDSLTALIGITNDEPKEEEAKELEIVPEPVFTKEEKTMEVSEEMLTSVVSGTLKELLGLDKALDLDELVQSRVSFAKGRMTT